MKNYVVLILLLCFSCPVTRIYSSTFLRVCHQLCHIHLEPESLSVLYLSRAKLGLTLADSVCTVLCISTHSHLSFYVLWLLNSANSALLFIKQKLSEGARVASCSATPIFKGNEFTKHSFTIIYCFIKPLFCKKNTVSSLLWSQRARWHELELPRAPQVLSLWKGQHYPHSQGSSTAQSVRTPLQNLFGGFFESRYFQQSIEYKGP